MRIAWTLAAPLGIGAVLAVAALSGCGNSTGPGAASFREARHLDTLAQAAAGGHQFDRFRLLQYPMAVLAQGIAPDTLSLTVDGGTAPYQVVGLDLVTTTEGPTPTPTDSLFVVVAWTGDDVSRLLYMIADGSSSLIDFALLDDADASFDLATQSVTASLASAAGTCRTLKLANAASLMQGTCTRATFNVSFDLTFVPNASHPSSHFALSQQTIPGVRLLMASSTGGQDRLLRHPPVLSSHP